MSVLAEGIRFDNDAMWVSFADGRTIGVPLAWFPRLMKAMNEDRTNYTISPSGLHWTSLDEDISIEGLLAGKGDRKKPLASTLLCNTL